MELSDLSQLFIGFGFGITATIVGIIVTDKLTSKRELLSFYSQIEALLDLLFNSNEIDEVKAGLTNPELHYLFNKLWTRIPKKRNDVAIRSLIFMFLKGGGKLPEIEKDKNIKKLYEWLKNKQNAT